jgi:iron complex transport system ATP-binding protein
VLRIINADCGYTGRKYSRKVLKGISMDIDHGMVMCVLGKNGAGKTTLFRTVLGVNPVMGGKIELDERNIADISRPELARRIAYVPQSHTPPFPFTVRQIVEMGRSAHMRIYSTPSKIDREKAEEAMEMMGIEKLADRPYTEISGGERQLALISRALAQESDYLIMDEPSANLDYGNQVRVMELVISLADAGKGIMLTTHYPDQVFMAGSQCTVIQSEDEFITGATENILTEETLKKIYGIDTKILKAELPDGRTVMTVAAFMDKGDKRDTYGKYIQE